MAADPSLGGEETVTEGIGRKAAGLEREGFQPVFREYPPKQVVESLILGR
jgi:hypothetical protein